jgi:hypothetical protein
LIFWGGVSSHEPEISRPGVSLNGVADVSHIDMPHSAPGKLLLQRLIDARLSSSLAEPEDEVEQEKHSSRDAQAG